MFSLFACICIVYWVAPSLWVATPFVGFDSISQEETYTFFFSFKEKLSSKRLPLLYVRHSWYWYIITVGGSSKAVAASREAASVHEQTGKAAAKRPIQKKEGPAVTLAAASEKKGLPPDKDRKKEVPPPRMQFDDKNRVEKAKKRSVVKQAEARNRVELFRHLPQYEHGTQLPDLESKFFQLDPVYPAVYKVD